METAATAFMILFSDAFIERQLTKLYDKGFDWMLVVGPRLILALVVAFAGFWAVKMLRKWLHKKMHRKNVHSSLRPFFISLFTTTLNVALVFLVMEILGIKLTMFAALVAAFGAAAGLALSGTLQNFTSGILILLLKPFTASDNIVTQGFEGTVTSIQLFYTVITTYDNKTVIMPNSKLSNEVIINMTQQGSRRLDFELTVPHTVEYEKIKTMLLQLYKEADEVCNDPPPRIGVSSIAKDGYNVINNIWLRAHGFEDSRQKINVKIIEALHAAGVYNSK